MPEIELICNDNNRCGEGPLWDAAHNRLIWNDLSSSLLYEYLPGVEGKGDGKGTHRVIGSGLMIAGEALNRDGRLVVVGATGLHLWAGQDKVVTLLREHEEEELFFNDMIAEPTGGIYAGTVYWDANGMSKAGKLYHIAPNGNAPGARVTVVDDGIGIANGLGFSPDNRTLYFADSAAREIYAYDLTPGQATPRNKRVFVRVGNDEGIPDGLTVDSEGFVYSAQWYGRQVVRYDPDGKVERRIKMPVTQIASVAFGGKDLCDLYITTAGDHWNGPLLPRGYDSSVSAGGGFYHTRMETPGKLEHVCAFM